MNSFYTNTLYPLQDKVLKLISPLQTPFYLTGGTALSRFYFNHRYSEDLDLFVNQDTYFSNYVERIISQLTPLKIFVIHRSESYFSIKADKILKVDFVNDTVGHTGKFKRVAIFSKIDSLENILANKVSALISREEPKDIVDLWIIAKNKKVNWKKTFSNVNTKTVGIFPPAVAEKISAFPVEEINQIKWVKKAPDKGMFKADLNEITRQILAL